jgi:hypothetical protein
VGGIFPSLLPDELSTALPPDSRNRCSYDRLRRSEKSYPVRNIMTVVDLPGHLQMVSKAA